MQSRDATGAALHSGGNNVFVQIEELCTVTTNYRCDRVPDTQHVLNGTIYQRMDDSNDGRYSTYINLKRRGSVTLSAVVAKVGGFYGEYFNNAFLDGVPAKTQVDPYLDFDWGTGLITGEAADFVSVQWFGRIRAPHSEEFTFILSADDGARMSVDGQVVADGWDTCCDPISFALNLTEGTFYDTLIEYRELQERARFRLEWVSLSVPRELVPPTLVYYPERVGGSVLQLAIGPGPSIPSRCTAEGDGLTWAVAGKHSYFYV
jgi:hypothetical protein